MYIYIYIQDDSGGKVINEGDDNICDYERKEVHMNVFVILTGYTDTAVKSPDLTLLDFFCVVS